MVIDPGQTLVELDMTTDASCSKQDYDDENPADVDITCRTEHNYTYIEPEDGDM